MAAYVPVGGAKAWTMYGWEANYGVESAALNKVFGVGQDITISPKRNYNKIRGIGYTDIEAVTPGKYEGSASVNWTLTNPWFFRMIFGLAADGGGGPFTHTWNTATAAPDSFSISTDVDATTDSSRVLLGCYATSLKIGMSVGEQVKCSADISYRTETEDAALDPIVSEAGFTPYYFMEGTITIGANVGWIQNCDFTITKNMVPLFECGSCFAHNFAEAERGFELTFTVTWSGPTHLDDFYGADGAPIDGVVASQPIMILTFDNGLGGINQRQIIITLTDLYFDTESQKYTPTDALTEDLNAFCTGFTSIVATDNTAVSL